MIISHQTRQMCIGAYVVLHFLTTYTASWFEVMPGISIWYAPCGLAMTLLFLLGPSYWPAVLAANLATAYLGHGLAEWWAPLLFPSLITLNYCLFALLLRRFFKAALLPDTLRRAAYFIVLMLLAPASMALFGSIAARLVAGLGMDGLWTAVLRWWVGDFCGILTVFPVAVVFVAPFLSKDSPAWWVPSGVRRPCLLISAQAATLFSCLALAFVIEPLRQYNAFYLCFLPLTWIALVHGLPGATLATLSVTIAGLAGIHCYGDSSEGLILNFFLFILAIAGVGMGLGAVVSSRHAMQQRFLAAQKMECFGIMAGGIAHDFNNLLTVVLGNASMARLDATAGSPLDESVAQIETAAKKASELCHQMLMYAGKAMVVHRVLDLHQHTAQNLQLVSGSLPAGCKLTHIPTAEPAWINADANQVGQALVTLLINASEAVPAGIGRIIVRTNRRHYVRADLRQFISEGTLEVGEYCTLEVEDNGCGIDPEVLGRIFEPFFSTKFIGKGMSLAAVLGIVKRHHGAIAVSSRLGQGTHFRVIFPAVNGPLKGA